MPGDRLEGRRNRKNGEGKRRKQNKYDDPEFFIAASNIGDLLLRIWGFDAKQFDFVISSLALHYLERFDAVSRRVFDWLTPGGTFVFSVEHLVFTACSAQEWCLGPAGERLHWPVDEYHKEGMRRTTWMADNVLKYHRTVASYVNELIDAGFYIAKVVEPTLTQELLDRRPEWRDERRRPMFLLIGAAKHW